MRGASGVSLETVRSGLDPVVRAAGTKAAVLGAQLFTIVDALIASTALRRAMSDPSRTTADKVALVRQLFADLDPRIVEVMVQIVGERWSSDEDLVDAVEEFAADAVLASAEAVDALPEVEDELFRIGRMLIGERELRRSLVDRTATASARADLAHALLAGKVHSATEQLVARAAYEPRGRTMARILTRLGKLAARRRELLVATVTAASPLTPAQVQRLDELLERAYGHPVRVAVAVDPGLFGGLRVQVGSQVVDATVLGRLDDVRRKLAG
jgi:F-type H+-transporting ATPase subunit delta